MGNFGQLSQISNINHHMVNVRYQYDSFLLSLTEECQCVLLAKVKVGNKPPYPQTFWECGSFSPNNNTIAAGLVGRNINAPLLPHHTRTNMQPCLGSIYVLSMSSNK